MERANTLAVTAIVLTFAGCGLPPDEQAPPPSADVLLEREYPMPEFPEEIASLIGENVFSTFADVSSDCVGNVDQLLNHYNEPRSGVRLSGWGYDLGASEAFQTLIATDSNGVIRGGGLGGIARPDVFSARAGEVKSENTGYEVLAGITRGSISVYGIDSITRSPCLVGLFQLSTATK